MSDHESNTPAIAAANGGGGGGGGGKDRDAAAGGAGKRPPPNRPHLVADDGYLSLPESSFREQFPGLAIGRERCAKIVREIADIFSVTGEARTIPDYARLMNAPYRENENCERRDLVNIAEIHNLLTYFAHSDVDTLFESQMVAYVLYRTKPKWVAIRVDKGYTVLGAVSKVGVQILNGVDLEEDTGNEDYNRSVKKSAHRLQRGARRMTEKQQLELVEERGNLKVGVMAVKAEVSEKVAAKKEVLTLQERIAEMLRLGDKNGEKRR